MHSYQTALKKKKKKGGRSQSPSQNATSDERQQHSPVSARPSLFPSDSERVWPRVNSSAGERKKQKSCSDVAFSCQRCAGANTNTHGFLRPRNHHTPLSQSRCWGERRRLRVSHLCESASPWRPKHRTHTVCSRDVFFSLEGPEPDRWFIVLLGGSAWTAHLERRRRTRSSAVSRLRFKLERTDNRKPETRER